MMNVRNWRQETSCIYGVLRSPFLSLWCTSIFVLVAFVAPSQAFAQSENRLFNKNAVAKANERETKARLSPGSNLANDRELSHELRLETVDDIILSNQRYNQLQNDYRGLLYLTSKNDWVDVGPLDELEQRSLAERMLIFQSARTLLNAIKGSPLEAYYRRSVRGLKKLRDATTVKVSPGEKNTFTVGEKVGTRKELFKFKFHASARNGIEPRIIFSDELQFRYEVLDERALLEYNINF